MTLREYVIQMLTRFHEMELAKIEYPGFNIKDIWRMPDGNVCVIVDNLLPIEEVADYDENGKLMYLGAEWTSYEEVKKEIERE